MYKLMLVLRFVFVSKMEIPHLAYKNVQSEAEFDSLIQPYINN